MQHRNVSMQKTNGFTLIELMVVLALVAIILSLAAPSFMNIIANNRVASVANELVTALNVGKSEAVRTGEHTVLCKSPDGVQCDTSASWSDGWLLFQDTDNNQAVNDGERIIRVGRAPDSRLDLDFYTANYIGFNPNGRTVMNENGHFCIRNTWDDTNSRAVVVTMAGHIRTETRSYDCS